MRAINFYRFRKETLVRNCLAQEKRFSALIFWGSLWGLTEASLGFLLHGLKIPGLAGSVLPAIAFYFLYRLYQSAGSAGDVIGASLIAAGLKSLDIAVSPVDLMSVINPVRAIIFEGLVAALALQVLNRRPVRSMVRIILSGLLFPFGSSLAYGLTAFIESSVFHSGNIFQTEPVNLIRFFLLSPLVTAFVITSWLMAGKVKDKSQCRKLLRTDSIRTDCLSEISGQPETFLNRLSTRPSVSLVIFTVAVYIHLISSGSGRF